MADADDLSIGVVRPATDADADRIVDILQESKRVAMPWLAVVHTDAEDRWWVREVLLAREEVWVHDARGRVDGVLAVHEGWVTELYVDPRAQGRGTGRRLLDLAKDLSDGSLRLFAFARNERARRFYEAAGFRVVASSDGSGNEEREPDVTYAWTR